MTETTEVPAAAAIEETPAVAAKEAAPAAVPAAEEAKATAAVPAAEEAKEAKETDAKETKETDTKETEAGAIVTEMENQKIEHEKLVARAKAWEEDAISKVENR